MSSILHIVIALLPLKIYTSTATPFCHDVNTLDLHDTHLMLPVAHPARHGRCAITTRVSKSFLRVGQFELYGRRARSGEATGREELELLARHALSREYPEQKRQTSGASLQWQVLAMVAEASRRFAVLAAEWIRVGCASRKSSPECTFAS